MRTKTLQEHEEAVTANGRDYLCLFERDAYGGYLVTCEDLPPLMVYGETRAEARTIAAEEPRRLPPWPTTGAAPNTYCDRSDGDVGLPDTGVFGIKIQPAEEFPSKTINPTSQGCPLHLAYPSPLQAIWPEQGRGRWPHIFRPRPKSCRQAPENSRGL